jgi:outer membrane protein assembly factor BamB
MSLLLALVAATGIHAAPASPPSDRTLRVAWRKELLAPALLEWKAREPGGPAVDPATGMVVVGARDGVVQAFQPDGTPLWHFTTQGPFEAPPAVEGDTVYAGSTDGRLYALERTTGEERWRYDAREEIGSRPVVADGVVYFSTMQDTVFALDAKTGAWKWHQRRESPGRFTIRGVAWPTVAGGLVYAGFADGTVTAMDTKTGAVKWERRAAPSGEFTDVDSTPQVADGRVYVAAYSGAVLALDAASGKVLWEVKAPEACRVKLAGKALVAVTAKSVLGLSPADGKQLWTQKLRGTPSGEPVVANRWILVPATDGILILDAASGHRLRFLDTGTGSSATPAVLGSRVYVLSNGGRLLALDLLQ